MPPTFCYYETKIPPQVGLAHSYAVTISVLKTWFFNSALYYFLTAPKNLPTSVINL